MISLREEIERGLEAARRAQTARGCGENEGRRLLERRGYHLSRKGRRATCPHCTNGRRHDFTVAVSANGQLFNCHRCHKGGNVRSLRPAFQFGQPKVRIRKADIPKRQFREWLAARMTELGNRERRMERKAVWRPRRLSSKSDGRFITGLG